MLLWPLPLHDPWQIQQSQDAGPALQATNLFSYQLAGPGDVDFHAVLEEMLDPWEFHAFMRHGTSLRPCRGYVAL